MTERAQRPVARGGGYQSQGPLRPMIAVHSSVIDQAVAEIRENPDIEVGGKFVGYVEGEFSSADEDWRDSFSRLRITVLGNLDPGPGRDRSAVHHYSDTDYQVRLFQRLAAEFPALCFLGIWHSHHPNGLHQLSGGDTQTGLQTVNSDGHDLDLLLSSLAFDAGGLLGGRHFVFFRGHRTYYEIDQRCVRVISGENPVGDAVTRTAGWLNAQRAGSRPPLPDGRARPDGRDGPPRRRAAWLQSDEGRAALAFDNAWLRAYPGLRPALRDGGVVWQGPADAGAAVLSCAYHLPDDPGSVPAAEFSVPADGLSLRFSLADPASRAATFAARLQAFSAMAAAVPEPRAPEQPATPEPEVPEPPGGPDGPGPGASPEGQSQEPAAAGPRPPRKRPRLPWEQAERPGRRREPRDLRQEPRDPAG